MLTQIKTAPDTQSSRFRAELQSVRYKTSKISTSFVGTDDASSSGMEVTDDVAQTLTSFS